jgi:hypothetical protein
MLAEVAPGAASVADGLVDDEQRVTGAEGDRLLPPLMLELRPAASNFDEVELVGEEAPRPLQVTDVIVQRFNSLDAEGHDSKDSAGLQLAKG